MKQRRRVGLALLLAALAASPPARAHEPTAAPCVTAPPAPGAAKTAPAAVTRIAGARYRCLTLPSGHALWVGESGSDARAGPPPPTVLLVHGLGPNAHADWALTVPELARQFRVVTVDLPGFGGSAVSPGGSPALDEMAALLAELAEHISPAEPVHLVGHSLGAALALQTAHRHPARVQRLVLVDAAGILLKPVFVQAVVQLQPRPVGFRPLDRLIDFVSGRANALTSLALLGHDQRADLMPLLQRYPELRRALIGGATQADLALHLVEHDFSAAIRQTQAPTTVLWGRLDRVAPLRTAEVLGARLPRARLQVLEGAGHTPMLETPEAFNQALLQALTLAPGNANDAHAALKPGATPGTASQGHVVCRDTEGARYSGRYDSLTLQRCGSVQIQRAHIGRLVLENATASLSNSHVESADVAIDATDSELIATASTVRGRIAIRAGNSWFDLAGVSLLASGPVLEQGTVPSRVFFSVSDWHGSDQRGDAHFVWPRRP